VDQPVQRQIVEFLLLIHVLGAPAWIGYGFIEASANVALFVPLGVVATLAFPNKRWWQIGSFGLLVSGFMELGQLLFLHSRFPSALDIVTNAAGCLLGFLLMAFAVRRRSGAGIS
jgi:glycopeptide antibiotics resistance protein